jgi:hypothetical protein
MERRSSASLNQASESDKAANATLEEPKAANAKSDKSGDSAKNETSSDANSQLTKVVEFKKLVDEEVNADAPKNETSTKDPAAKDKTGDTPVERRQLPDVEKSLPDLSKTTPDLSQMTPDLWSNAPDLSSGAPDLSGEAPDLWNNAPTLAKDDSRKARPDLSQVRVEGPDFKTGGLHFKRQFYDWNEKTIAQAEAKAKFHDEMQSEMNHGTPTAERSGKAAFKAPAPVSSKPASAGLDAINEQMVTLLNNLPTKRQESEEEKVETPAVDAKNVTSAASNKTTSAASGFHGINDKLDMLNKLPIGGLPIKRQAPEAPTVPVAKPSGSNFLDKYLVSLKNQHEKPAAAAAPSVPSQEEIATVAADASWAALADAQPEIEETSPLVAEAAASSAEVKPKTEESSPLPGMADEKPESMVAPELATMSEEKPEIEESSPIDSLADEKLEKAPTPEAAVSSLETLPESEESSPLDLAGLVSEQPKASPATEEIPAIEESSPLASLVEEKPEKVAAPTAASEPKPEIEESSPLSELAGEKSEDLPAPKAVSELKPETKESSPLADLAAENPEELSASKTTSELKPEIEESSPVASLVEEKPEDLAVPTTASELKPEANESAPLADLTDNKPEASSALSAAELPASDPKSDLASPLAGLMG